MRILISVVFILLFFQTANAQSWFGRLFGGPSENVQVEQQEQAAFSAEDRRRIEEYFLGRDKGNQGKDDDTWKTDAGKPDDQDKDGGAAAKKK